MLEGELRKTYKAGEPQWWAEVIQFQLSLKVPLTAKIKIKRQKYKDRKLLPSLTRSWLKVSLWEGLSLMCSVFWFSVATSLRTATFWESEVEGLTDGEQMTARRGWG